VKQRVHADGSIDYILADARIQAAIPVLSGNPFINSYSVIQRERDVVVRLSPAADATVFIESAGGPGAYRTVIGARGPGAAAPAIRHAQADAATGKPKAVARSVPPASAPKDSGTEKIEITRKVTPAMQAETYYRQGLDKLQADRIEAAVSDLRAAVRLRPVLHDARELLAALLLRSGRSAEAHAELQQGMRLEPGHIAYARLYAQSLIEAGDPAEALRVLAESEPYAAQQPDYRAFMGAVAQRLARHDESVRHYMAALALKPARGAWWVGLAISLEALGRGQEAARAYRTALAETELNADLINYARARVTQLDVTAAGG
jgi:MSHA biogenesis protein MshN